MSLHETPYFSIFQGTQRENEKMMIQLERGQNRQKLLEGELRRCAYHLVATPNLAILTCFCFTHRPDSAEKTGKRLSTYQLLNLLAFTRVKHLVVHLHLLATPIFPRPHSRSTHPRRSRLLPRLIKGGSQ